LDARSQLVSALAMARTDYSELEQQRRRLQVELQETPMAADMLYLEALHSLGLWAGAVRRYDESATYYEQVCSLASESQTHRRVQLIALNNLGDLALRRGDYAKAQHVLSNALQLASNTRLRGATTYLHLNLGIAKMRDGDHEGAEAEYDTSMHLMTAIEDVRGIFSLTLGRAELAVRRGDQADAAALFRAALTMSEEHGFNDAKQVLAYCIDRIKRGQGQYIATDPVYRDWLEISGW
jgi:tetratricopeptide (TPR) repeat protein